MLTKLSIATILDLGLIVVSNGQDLGTWTIPSSPLPLFAIHVAHLPTGDLLIANRERTSAEFGTTAITPFRVGKVNSAAQLPYGSATSLDFWDNQEHTPYNLFCSGHTMLWDGNIVFAGGHMGDDVGTTFIQVFDWKSQSFAPWSEMAQRRWYPTVFALPNRRVLILSGTMNRNQFSGSANINQRAEIWMYRVGANQNQDYLRQQPLPAHKLDRYFPHTFIDPRDGNVLVMGNGVPEDRSTNNYVANPNEKLNLATLQWSTYLPLPSNLQNIRLDYPSACMVDGIIVRSGGSRPDSSFDTDSRETEDPPTAASAVAHASRTALYINLNDANPQWKPAPDAGGADDLGKMRYGRKDHNLIALPDGQVLAMAGCQHGARKGGYERLAPEIWNPAQPGQPWRLLNPPPETSRNNWGRGYHGSSILLPNGRIFLSGGEYEYNNFSAPSSDQVGRSRYKRSAMIYSPPYGGRNDWESVRPVIVESPKVIRYGQTFPITVETSGNRPVAKIALVTMGTMTHAFASNQNVIFLNKDTLPASPGRILVRAPLFTRQATPDYYMLFALDNQGNGIPSEAKIVQLRDLEPGYPDTVTVTQAGSLQTTATYQTLLMGDNDYLAGTIASDSSNTVKFETEAMLQSTEAPSQLRIQLEGRSSVATNVGVSLFNWITQTWQPVSTGTLGTTDNQAEFTISGLQCRNLVNPSTHRIRARFEIGGLVSFGAFIDSVEFGLLPSAGPVRP